MSLIWDWIANPKPLLKEDSPSQQTIKAYKTPSFSLVHKLVSSIWDPPHAYLQILDEKPA
jgi:hypothetical protein